MMDRKEKLYTAIFLVGISTLVGGLLHSYIARFLIASRVIIASYDWLIMIGIIFTFAGLILLFSNKYKFCQKHVIKANILEVILIIILIVSSAGVGGWLYGQYQNTLLVSTENIQRIGEQLKMRDQTKNDSPFYCKKVIIRDDDIGDSLRLPSIEWISKLAIRKDVKVTFSVIPATLVNNSGTIDYLNQLDRKHFEFATHGYEHIPFRGLSYDKQYSLIEKGTNVMEECLHYKPYTFVPPYGSGDANTTKACRILGYHSITDMIGYPSWVVDFKSDLEYETSYRPPEHHTFEEVKSSFDSFYNSSDEYYIVYLHDWTFLNEEGKLDEAKAQGFEKVIDYIKSKNVQFMTIEEAYEWHVDEKVIRTGMINENAYFIDLKECRYNHTIKFSSPSSWDVRIILRDITIGEEAMFYKNVFEFDGIEGHLYEICLAT